MSDEAPAGAVWVCLACGLFAATRSALESAGCSANVALCMDDQPKGYIGKYRWRLYEPRG